MDLFPASRKPSRSRKERLGQAHRISPAPRATAALQTTSSSRALSYLGRTRGRAVAALRTTAPAICRRGPFMQLESLSMVPIPPRVKIRKSLALTAQAAYHSGPLIHPKDFNTLQWESATAANNFRDRGSISQNLRGNKLRQSLAARWHDRCI